LQLSVAGAERPTENHRRSGRRRSDRRSSDRPGAAPPGVAEHAREKNAELATNLITRLRQLLGRNADVNTVNYSLTKAYTGEFVASNMIQVQLSDPGVTSKAIDLATKSSALPSAES
jgi:hypothetical protein